MQTEFTMYTRIKFNAMVERRNESETFIFYMEGDHMKEQRLVF